MSESPLFKRAFVRGLNAELIRQGVAVYPSKEAADFSADYVADNSNMPDPYTQADKVSLKTAAALCDNLVKAAQHFCEREGNRYDPSVTKTAQESTPVAIANTDCWSVMQKCAAETGSLMEGGDNQNDMPAAAGDNAEAAQEQNRRGENYANMGEDGVGNYERKGEGNVGTEEDHPEKPKATEEGSNSVVENTRKHSSAGNSLADIVARVQKSAADTGSLMDPGSEKNDLPAAAANNAEAAQEMNRRGENYANKGEKGVGQSDMVPGPAAFVGHEQDHPLKPKATDSGSNVVTQHVTKKSAFDSLFEDTARQVVPYLPEKMEENHKVAHVRACMGLETRERASYLRDVYVNLGAEKTAAEDLHAHFLKSAEKDEMPPAMGGKEYPMGDKKEKAKDEECDSEDDKSEEKEASASPSLSDLRQRLASLNV